MTRNAVAFFSDRAMLPGLHVALLSMCQTNERLDADTFVFSDGLRGSDIDLLHETWAMGSASRLIVRPFKPNALGNALHGNATAWGRVFLGDLLPDYDRCVYLDCDLIVNAGLKPLFNLLTQQVLLAADCTGDRKWSLDKDLFIAAGISLDGSCFNSGVLALNLAFWRSSDVFDHCKAVAEQFKGRFASADQALLNVALHDQVIAFGDKYNSPLYPMTVPPSPLEERIYHFVGSPKPWDMFGSSLHRSFQLWRDVFGRTAIANHCLLRYLKMRRIIRTSRQLFKAWSAQRTKSNHDAPR